MLYAAFAGLKVWGVLGLAYCVEQQCASLRWGNGSSSPTSSATTLSPPSAGRSISGKATAPPPPPPPSPPLPSRSPPPPATLPPPPPPAGSRNSSRPAGTPHHHRHYHQKREVATAAEQQQEKRRQRLHVFGFPTKRRGVFTQPDGLLLGKRKPHDERHTALYKSLDNELGNKRERQADIQRNIQNPSNSYAEDCCLVL